MPDPAADTVVREPATSIAVTTRVNGAEHARTVEARLLLSDFLRHELGLTGTHVGCEQGVCGACTVLWDGRPVRSCLTLAPQAEGADLDPPDDEHAPAAYRRAVAAVVVERALRRLAGLPGDAP